MRHEPPCHGDFTVDCPATGAVGTPVAEIRARGNLALILDHQVVFELQRALVKSSWRSACSLAPCQVSGLMAKSARYISEALDDDAWDQTPGLAANAAAFFLLALRHQGLHDLSMPKDCTIRWQAASPTGASVAFQN